MPILTPQGLNHLSWVSAEFGLPAPLPLGAGGAFEAPVSKFISLDGIAEWSLHINLTVTGAPSTDVALFFGVKDRQGNLLGSNPGGGVTQAVIDPLNFLFANNVSPGPHQFSITTIGTGQLIFASDIAANDTGIFETVAVATWPSMNIVIEDQGGGGEITLDQIRMFGRSK